MQGPRTPALLEEDGSETESSSDSHFEQDVAQLVFNLVDENDDSLEVARKNSFSQVETQYQLSVRAASLYMALFNGEHSKELVLGPGPNSVYTASIIFPQIARSSGYQLTYVAVSLKMILLAVLCAMVQLVMVMNLWKATLYEPTQNGVPHICTYGQDTGGSSVPRGPLGMAFEKDKSNLESDYSMVILRNTLWEVMQHLNISNPSVGPVDYGEESPNCRFACILAFLVTIISELQGNWGMARFVFLSPTLHGRTENHAEQWISFDEPDPETKRLMSLLGKKDIDCITFKMAGMPLRWKVLWAWPVILVRFMITSVLAFVGFRFLMNSAGVIDLILNAVALFFIVELDLIMFTTFAKDMTRDIMDRLEPYRMPAERAKIESFVWKALRQEKSYTSWDVIRRTIRFSRVIVAVFFLQWMMFLGYFMSHCQMEAWPLTSPMLRDKYYHDGSLLAWNWEFFTGQWRSKNITKRLWMQGPSNETLCAPHGNAGEIVGCGLPTPWHGPRG